MSKRKKIIIGITALILIVVGLIILLSRATNKEEERLVERPGLPREEGWRVIREESEGELKLIRNNFDGYAIKVPSEWDTETETSRTGGHLIAYGDSENSLTLRIFTISSLEEAKSYFPDSAKFEKLNTPNNLIAYKSIQKLTEDRFDERSSKVVEAPIEDSALVGFIFPSDPKSYVLICGAMGRKYEELVSQCEKQVIDTFTIID